MWSAGRCKSWETADSCPHPRPGVTAPRARTRTPAPRPHSVAGPAHRRYSDLIRPPGRGAPREQGSEVFGREADSARVEQLLDALPSGPVGLALEGAPGIGKTTLWRDGVASARDRGYEVIATAPAE